MIKDPGAD
jgi:hypothetical protein